VRALAFGPEKEFTAYLGYKVAAFEVENYRPRDELDDRFHEIGGHGTDCLLRDSSFAKS
jgi:hypothetical protein